MITQCLLVATILTAPVTAYTASTSETDSTPCIGAGNHYICDRSDVVACPRSLQLHQWVEIEGKRYECLDRLNKRYTNRFDLFMGYDRDKALRWGIKTLKVKIL